MASIQTGPLWALDWIVRLYKGQLAGIPVYIYISKLKSKSTSLGWFRHIYLSRNWPPLGWLFVYPNSSLLFLVILGFFLLSKKISN